MMLHGPQKITDPKYHETMYQYITEHALCISASTLSLQYNHNAS